MSKEKPALQTLLTTQINVRRRSLLNEWAWALRRDKSLSLLDNLLSELCDYFGVSRDEALRRGRMGDDALREEWLAMNPQDAEQIAHFYKSSETYIYELMYWHSCAEDLRPLLYVPAVRLAHAAGAIKYLDFGSGVGSQGILFARHGMEVTLADIAPQMLDFCRWRFRRHELEACLIDLNDQPLPAREFDFITAMEVLEHVPDPLETMRTLVKALKPGGLVYFSAPFYSDELRPMHVVTDPNALWAIRSLGLQRVPVYLPDPTFHVYRRVERPQAVSYVLAGVDRLTHNRYADAVRNLPGRTRNKLVYEWGRLMGGRRGGRAR